MPEFTNRAPFTLSAASFAASSSATLSSIGTSNGSIFDRAASTCRSRRRRHGREHDGPHERGAIRLRLRDGLTRDARHLIRREIAARGEAPRAVHEHAHAEAEGLGVGQRLHAMLARLDGLIAILADAHVRVFGAGGLRGIERAHRELLECRIGERR